MGKHRNGRGGGLIARSGAQKDGLVNRARRLEAELKKNKPETNSPKGVLGMNSRPTGNQYTL